MVEPQQSRLDIDFQQTNIDMTHCPICFCDTNLMYVFSCNHHICDQCFEEWFVRRKNTKCCVCRTVVVFHTNTDNNEDIINVDNSPVRNNRKIDCVTLVKINIFYIIVSVFVTGSLRLFYGTNTSFIFLYGYLFICAFSCILYTYTYAIQ